MPLMTETQLVLRTLNDLYGRRRLSMFTIKPANDDEEFRRSLLYHHLKCVGWVD